MPGVFGLLNFDGSPTNERDLSRLGHAQRLYPDELCGLKVAGPCGFGTLGRPGTANAGAMAELPGPGLLSAFEASFYDLSRLGALSSPDCPVLSGFEQWGEEVFDRMVGDFAVAIWEERTQTLYCARDPFGIKPFFYAHGSNRFAFSSGLKPLVRWLQGRTSLSMDGMTNLLTGYKQDHESTFYNEIKRLPPGHILSVSRTGLRLQRYWKPWRLPELRGTSPEEVGEEFARILSETVSSQAKTGGPQGIALSSGLDSNAIAYSLPSVSSPARTSYTWVMGHAFPGEDLSEFEFDLAGETSRELGLTHRPVTADHLPMLLNLSRFNRELEQPVSDVRHTFMEAMFAAAREDGVSTLFWGIGGDEFASHNARDYRLGLFLSGRWWGIRHGFRSQVLPKLLRGLKGRSMLHLERFKEPEFLVGRSMLHPDLKAGVLERMRSRSLPSGMSRFYQNTSRAAMLRTASDCLLTFALDFGFSRSRNFGIESRFPLLDRRVVEFCISQPLEEHAWGGQTRSIMRRALSRKAPPTISQKATQPIPTPGYSWQIANEWREARSFLKTWRAIAPDLVDFDKLDSTAETYARNIQAGKTSLSPVSFMRAVFLLEFFRTNGLADGQRF